MDYSAREMDAPRHDTPLSAELERALLVELKRSWGELNYLHFREAMRSPTLELTFAPSPLGTWRSESRTLTISRHLVLGQPWGVVVEVLKHEMAHQFVDEVLRVSDETAHGRAFRDVCARLGIDAAASGLPQARARSPEDERVLERVAKLLALAESDNRHEAEAAMRAAQQLLWKHNLDAAEARRERGYGFRHLGQPSGRVQEHERFLASILGRYFFVEVIWVPVYRPLEGKRGSVLEVVGSEENLEMATFVHGFLLETAERLWQAHKRERGIRGDRDRRAYLAGVMTGFRDQLAEGARESRERGLVWIKDAKLDEAFRSRHPRVVTVRYGGGGAREARDSGRAAGKGIVLSRPVKGGPSGGVRLLKA